jgi:hypothetical protein
MEIDIDRLKELIGQREQIDAEIVATVGTIPVPVQRKAARCSKCGQEGHRATTCRQPTE